MFRLSQDTVIIERGDIATDGVKEDARLQNGIDMKIDRINPQAGYSPDNCIATMRIYYYRIAEWNRECEVAHSYEWLENAHAFSPPIVGERTYFVFHKIASALIKIKK